MTELLDSFERIFGCSFKEYTLETVLVSLSGLSDGSCLGHFAHLQPPGHLVFFSNARRLAEESQLPAITITKSISVKPDKT